MNRSSCRGCSRQAPRGVLAKQSRSKPPVPDRRSPSRDRPERRKSPSTPTSPSVPSSTAQSEKDSAMTGIENDMDPAWASMTVQELKATVTKVESLIKSLKEAGCLDAAMRVESRIGQVRECLAQRLPPTQRLEQLMASLRRAKQAKEKADERLQSLLQEVCEAEAKQRDLEKQVEEAEEAVHGFQNDMLSKCAAPTPPADAQPDELEAALHELTQQIPGNLMGLAKKFTEPDLEEAASRRTSSSCWDGARHCAYRTQTSRTRGPGSTTSIGAHTPGTVHFGFYQRPSQPRDCACGLERRTWLRCRQESSCTSQCTLHRWQVNSPWAAPSSAFALLQSTSMSGDSHFVTAALPSKYPVQGIKLACSLCRLCSLQCVVSLARPCLLLLFVSLAACLYMLVRLSWQWPWPPHTACWCVCPCSPTPPHVVCNAVSTACACLLSCVVAWSSFLPVLAYSHVVSQTWSSRVSMSGHLELPIRCRRTTGLLRNSCSFVSLRLKAALHCDPTYLFVAQKEATSRTSQLRRWVQTCSRSLLCPTVSCLLALCAIDCMGFSGHVLSHLVSSSSLQGVEQFLPRPRTHAVAVACIVWHGHGYAEPSASASTSTCSSCPGADLAPGATFHGSSSVRSEFGTSQSWATSKHLPATTMDENTEPASLCTTDGFCFSGSSGSLVAFCWQYKRLAQPHGPF